MNLIFAGDMRRNPGHPNRGITLPADNGEPEADAAFDFDRVCFLLDIDGTLLDFAPTPAGVLVSARLQASLAKLWMKTGGAVALVSGRALADIDGIFAPLELPAIGGHGAEIRPRIKDGLLPGHSPLLDERIRRGVVALAEKGVLVEDKGYSMAVHYRLAPELKEKVERRVKALLSGPEERRYELLRGKCVIEIKPKTYNKGSAVLELLDHAPFKGRRPVFIGDDVTDEAVFEILPEVDGIGFSVGALMEGAVGVFGKPQDVRDWIARVAGGA